MKYLGIRIDNLIGKPMHIDNVVLTLIRANAMLYKVRDQVNA